MGLIQMGLQFEEQLPVMVAMELNQLVTAIQAGFNNVERLLLNQTGAANWPRCIINEYLYSLVSGAEVAIPFTGVMENNGLLFDRARPTRITVQPGGGGFYVFLANMTFNTAGGATRQSRFVKNGDSLLLLLNQYGFNVSNGLLAAGSTCVTNHLALNLVAGDYIELWGYQDSGGPIVCQTVISAFKIGPVLQLSQV